MSYFIQYYTGTKQYPAYGFSFTEGDLSQQKPRREELWKTCPGGKGSYAQPEHALNACRVFRARMDNERDWPRGRATARLRVVCYQTGEVLATLERRDNWSQFIRRFNKNMRLLNEKTNEA